MRWPSTPRPRRRPGLRAAPDPGAAPSYLAGPTDEVRRNLDMDANPGATGERSGTRSSRQAVLRQPAGPWQVFLLMDLAWLFIAVIVLQLTRAPAARRYRHQHRCRARARGVRRPDRADSRHAGPEQTPGDVLTMAITVPAVPGPAWACPGSPGSRERERIGIDPTPSRDHDGASAWHGAAVTVSRSPASRASRACYACWSAGEGHSSSPGDAAQAERSDAGALQRWFRPPGRPERGVTWYD
jgi:hypothetical protein